jgi:hypothetical protein
MDIHVSDKARKATTNCKKEFSCLEREGNNLCTVESCIDGKLHFIQCLNKGYCSYQHLFGYRFLCGCPVRKEIFNTYKI